MLGKVHELFTSTDDNIANIWILNTYMMQALTEPDYGSDASSLATTASKVFLFMFQMFLTNSIITLLFNHI